MKKVIMGGICLVLAFTSCNGGKSKENGNGYLIEVK